MLEDDLYRFFNLPVPLGTFGIIEYDNKIRSGSALYAFFDGFPRRQQVAKADDRIVVHERGAQGGGGGVSGRNARNNFYGQRDVFLRNHLENKSRHTINTGVAAADDAYRFPFLRLLNGQIYTLNLFSHG